MTEEERVEELSNMHRCLDAAAKVWTLISKAEPTDGEFGILSQDDIMAAIGLIFPTPLAEYRQVLVMKEIADIINDYKLSSCGLWHFAHMLLHIIFDEDVPRHG